MYKRILRLVAISISLVVVLLCLVIYDFVTFNCSFDEKYAYKKVINHLAKNGLDKKYLKLVRADSEKCLYTYTYITDKDSITFRVIDDYIHGAEVGWYDHNDGVE